MRYALSLLAAMSAMAVARAIPSIELTDWRYWAGGLMFYGLLDLYHWLRSARSARR